MEGRSAALRVFHDLLFNTVAVGSHGTQSTRLSAILGRVQVGKPELHLIADALLGTWLVAVRYRFALLFLDRSGGLSRI